MTKERAITTSPMMINQAPSISVIEVYGRSLSDSYLVTRQDVNITGLGALDLRATKPNGRAWEFTQRANHRLARELVDKQNPDWIVSAPPYTPFSMWSYGMNYQTMDPGQAESMIAEGRVHLHVVCSSYRKEVARGNYFLRVSRSVVVGARPPRSIQRIAGAQLSEA